MFIHSRRSYQADRLSKIDNHVPRRKGSWPLAGKMLKLVRYAHPGWAELLCSIGSTSFRRYHLFAYGVFFSWSRGDTQTLKRRSESALFCFPKSPYFRRMLATVIADQWMPERALAILGREELLKEQPSILALRARLHQRRGELDKAGSIAMLAKQRFPMTPWPSRILAGTLFDRGQKDEAARVAAEAMAKFPENGYFPGLLSTIQDESAGDPLQEVIDRQLRTGALEALGTLKPREAEILKLRFGIDCESRTLREIGARYRLSRERIRQIEITAIRKIHAALFPRPSGDGAQEPRRS